MKKIYFSIFLCIGALFHTYSQAYEEKIISSELKELIRNHPDSTRIVIVCLEPDEHIRELQLKSETRSPYINLSYNERTALALSHKNLQDGYAKLLQLGEPFYAPYGEETPEGPRVDSTHYYLFMNSFLFKATARNIKLMRQLNEVELIIDGDLQIEFSSDKTYTPIEKMNEPDSVESFELINQHYNLKDAVNDVLYFLDEKNRVVRFDKIELNESIKAIDDIKVNDYLTLNLFKDVNLKSLVTRTNINNYGTLLIRTKILGYNYAYAMITTTSNRTLVDVFIPELRKWYLILSDPITFEHFCIEMDYNSREPQRNDPIIELDLEQDSVEDSFNYDVIDKIKNGKQGVNDIAEIDVMIVYTEVAANWANNHGGIDNIIEQAMDKAQLVLDNSNTLITINLIYSGMIEYSESGNTRVDLLRLSHPAYKPAGNTWTEKDSVGNVINVWPISGYIDEVHELRNMYGADLVSFFTLAGSPNIAGSAWQLNNKKGRENRAFSITRIQVAATSFTHIHEMGHNMGLHHHAEQNRQPGPTNWQNWSDNGWSAGWRWQGNDNKFYCSVMTYESGQFFPDGISHTRVPYFSNPSISYEGVSIGNDIQGDNSRTLREIKHEISNYRQRQLIWDSLIVANWGYENLEIAHLHNLGYKGEGIRIGILDTGIDHDHPLVNMMVNGNEWHENKLNVVETGYVNPPVFWNSKDKDDYGHGTAVAGVIWQMAPKAEFVIYKIIGHDWNYFNTWWLTNAINDLLSKDVNVINHSRSSILSNNCPTSLDQTDVIFNEVYNQNVIPVNAAGNLGGVVPSIYPVSPGLGENVFSVFSTNQFNGFSSGNSPMNPCLAFNKPDLAAPGAGIKTLTRAPLGYYQTISGSSFAAPHTAGIAAILKQVAASELGVIDNSDIVMNSIRGSLLPVNTIPAAWGDFRPGRINAWAAYQYMMGPQLVTLTPEYVTTHSAKLGGNVTGQGLSGVIDYGFYWGVNEDVVDSGMQISVGNGTGEFFTTITGLEKNTTYYFRAYATNSQGTNYGDILSFTTPAASNVFVYNAPSGQSDAPVVQLTQETLGNLDVSLQYNEPLTLTFEISDPSKSINTARLFYKKTDSEIYNNVDLVHVNGDIYEYTIPGSEIISGSLNFFLTASDDDDNTVSLPVFQYLEYPYSMTVQPNLKPQISHDPVHIAKVGDIITLEASITDPTANINEVRLLFRNHDHAIYNIQDMSHLGGNVYTADLPEISMNHYEIINPIDGENGLDYVIKVIDELGAISYFPENFNEDHIPHHITVELRQEVTFYVYDQFGDPVEHAEITISEYTDKKQEVLNDGEFDNSIPRGKDDVMIITDNEGIAMFFGTEGEYFYSISKPDYLVGSGILVIENSPVHESVFLELESLPGFQLFLAANPNFAGEVSGAGEYEYGSEVTIEAFSAEGYDFSFWSWEEDTISESSVFSFSMPNENIGIIANFSPSKYALYIDIEPEEGGMAEGHGNYHHQEMVILSAFPDAGYEFLGWSGDIDYLNNPNSAHTYLFMPMAELHLVANFGLKSYDISVNMNLPGGGSVEGAGVYEHGNLVSLVAIPSYGYEFLNWTDENGLIVSAQNNYAFYAINNLVLTANFQKKTFHITASANPLTSGFVNGVGDFLYETEITLIAIPASDYQFSKWTEDGNDISYTQVYSFSLESDRNLVAHFVNKDYILLSDYLHETTMESGFVQLTVTADQPWVATPERNWLSVYPNYGNSGSSEVMITWMDNTDNEIREAAVVFHNEVADASFSVTQEFSVSVPDIDPDEIFVFPNPAKDGLNIHNIPHGAHFFIADVQGSEVLRVEQTEEKMFIDISFLHPGFYNLIVVTRDRRIVKKVILF